MSCATIKKKPKEEKTHKQNKHPTGGKNRSPDKNSADHSISERFVLQKDYRMNHCQITLNTDQTLKQRTTSEDQSLSRKNKHDKYYK